MSSGGSVPGKGPPGCALTAARVTYFIIVVLLAFFVVSVFSSIFESSRHPPGLATLSLLDRLSIALQEYANRHALSLAFEQYANRFGAWPKGPIGMTAARATEQYVSRSRVYPPDRATGIHPDLDKPAECLVYYLIGGSIAYAPPPPRGLRWTHPVFADPTPGGSRRKSLPVFYLFKEQRLVDTDSDGIPEVADEWGTPLFYNSGSAADGPFNQNGAPTRNPGRFDLSSAGPDRIHGTADDIRSGAR